MIPLEKIRGASVQDPSYSEIIFSLVVYISYSVFICSFLKSDLEIWVKKLSLYMLRKNSNEAESHYFSTFTKFSEKLTCPDQGVRNNCFFRKFCELTKWMIPRYKKIKAFTDVYVLSFFT